MASDGSEAQVARVEPVHVADDASYSMDHFCVPECYRAAISQVLIPHGLVADRVERLALDICEAYEGRVPHLLCVLKGAAEFFNDLCRAIRTRRGLEGWAATRARARTGTDSLPVVPAPYTFDFVRCKSYDGTSSTGTVSIEGLRDESIRDRDVIIVEDIVDTGRTLAAVLPELKRRGAATVEICALVEKRTHLSIGLKARFTGFSIPDKFVVGYGLDYDEAFRDMEHICVVSDAGIKSHKGWDRLVGRKPSAAPSSSSAEAAADKEE
jgi:hypoxanthine phosphoribosyltransferase